MAIKQEFKKYLEEAIGVENAHVAFSAFNEPASVSIRYNPYKKNKCLENFLDTKNVEWSEYGRILKERPVFTLDPYFHAGCYYVQDSSSMFVGEVFRRYIDKNINSRPYLVLDLCAAPGGKTTDLAASLRQIYGDNFLLVANEVVRQRAVTLADNVSLWGDPNVIVSSNDPLAFAKLPGFFDVIVADVPCSGEGMFRKDEEAQNQWSEANVALSQARQRRIVADAWSSLREGGLFIYSTCTFNKLENDDNVEWIAKELGAEIFEQELDFKGVLKTKSGYSLIPGFVSGEGQYCSAMRKTSSQKEANLRPKNVKTSSVLQDLTKLFIKDVVLVQKGETIIAQPTKLSSYVNILAQALQLQVSGCTVGNLKGKKLIPSADLSLSIILNNEAFPSVELTKDQALEYLHRDVIYLPEAPKGFIRVKYDGVALGFVKNLGARCNNLHPQNRRIRMDIK